MKRHWLTFKTAPPLKLNKIQNNMTTIQKNTEQPIEVARPKPVNIEALLTAAMERGPDIVERMMQVRRELNAEAAKAACDEAIREFQRKCPRIGKTKGVPDKFGNRAYAYTPLEEIIGVIQPILDECSLSYSFDTDVQSQNGWVITICDITHVAGHSFRKQAKFPLGTKTNIMSDTQQYSAALTFANRRVLCNALGIVTVGDDQDGQEAWRAKQQGPKRKPEGKPPTESKPEQPTGETAPELQAKLWAMLKDVRGENWNTAKKWLASKKIVSEAEKITAMSVEELKIVIDKVSIELEGVQ
jgi:hypothetical protein